MIKQIVMSAAFAATLTALPAQAVYCWGLAKPGEIVSCLEGNSFKGKIQEASLFYSQWNATYNKPPLPIADLSRLGYVESPAGSSIFNLFSKDGQLIAKIQNGNVMVSLPANLVAAGGGNLIGNDGSTIAGIGASMATAIAKQLEKNPPVAAIGGYRVLAVNDLRSLKARSARR